MEKNRSDTTREFTLKSLQDITNNFSREHIIGSGGYGVVYKGVLENGEEIAIKKLHYMPGLDDTQFRNEFNNLMRVQHRNITRLVGYCYHLGHERIMYNGEYVFAHVEERVLCFEYLPGGSLDKYISDESRGLDWNMRYKIIKGVCEGLNYLHNGYKDPIYHLDLKPANILLDKYMMPKIGDFGLSRLFPSAHTYTTIKIIGTPGYMPPEYIEKYEITSKFDVFSLGVIIIRIIAGDEGYSKRANMSSQEFVEHVHENWRRRLREIMPLYTSQQVMTCIEIALRCVETDRVRRPTISEIVMELNKIDTFKSSAIRELSAFWRQWLDVEDTDDDHGFEYTDDEPVVAPPHSDTRVQLMIKEYINKVPLDETKKKVMLELTGSGSAGDRLGLDVVVILDMSGSIQGEKIQEMKTAMKFIIDKLSPIDRLSIVTLSTAVHRLCPLRRITKTSQSELQGLIDGLIAGGNVANISDGLQTGLKVLADRKINRDRIVGVMIMSNGLLTNRGNQVADRHGNVVPVYTFGFGADHGPMVFHEVINQRKGPSFSTATQEMDGLRLALSRCLDSLLTIVVQDLSLTVACIEKESAMLVKVITDGRHQQTQDAPHGSVTVSIGNLSSREVCKLTVYLLLSAIKSERSMDILKITYSYSTSGELFVAPPLTLTLWCTDTGMAVLEKEKRPEAPREEICVQQMVKKTSTKAATSSSDLCYSCPQRPPARTRADHDYFVKLLLVGSYSAGKSKLLLRFTDGSFTTSYISTMGIDSKTRTVDLDGKRIKVLVWVTAEQEFLRDISTAYYRGAMGILLVYDVTDELSFNSIRSVYHRNIEELAPVGVNKILVGNKTDMDESRWAVPTSRGQALADEYGIRFFETSAKTDMNVEEAFFSLVRDIMLRLPPETDYIPMDPTIEVETSQRRHINPLTYALKMFSKKK